MFGFSGFKLIAMLILVAGTAIGTATITHKVDNARFEKLELGYAQAKEKAVEEARAAQAAQDKIALTAAVAEATAQEKIVTINQVITKEIPSHVKDSGPCITYGLVRVLDGAASGRDPDTLALPTGKSDDACSPVKASDLAQSVADNYGAARQNSEQLTALQQTAKDLIAAWPASKVSATVPRSEERLASLDRRVPVQVNLSVHAAPTSVPAWNAGLTPAQSVAAWNTYLAAQHGSGG